MALSSAQRKFIPDRGETASASSGRAGAVCTLSASASMGNSSTTSKRVPLPVALSTRMVPPIRSTMLLVMAMPRPVPCTLLVPDFSSRVKGSKRVFW